MTVSWTRTRSAHAAVTAPAGLSVLPTPVPALGEHLAGVSWALRSGPGAAAHARAAARRLLREWHPEVPAGLAADLTTVLSELVANACSHGMRGTPGPARQVTVEVLRTGAQVACVVGDPSALPPRFTVPDTDAGRGRGLHIVDQTAPRWGWYPDLSGSGKLVWAVFDMRTAPEPVPVSQ